MRTTLNIDDDVLAATKELARRQHKTAGEVISQLLRRALTHPIATDTGKAVREPATFYGFRPFASRGVLVTDESVERLRDEEGI